MSEVNNILTEKENEGKREKQNHGDPGKCSEST